MIAYPVGYTPREKQTFALAYARAQRIGLRHEDAQDCALAFMQHLIRASERAGIPEPGSPNSVAWLHRCAHNFACNYLRSLMRHKKREITLKLERTTEKREAPQPAALPPPPGPNTLTLRKEFWKQLEKTLETFTPSQRDLFIRYHFRHEGLLELAAQTGRTPHALSVSLSSMRKHLALLLVNQGWKDADVRALFGSRPNLPAAAPQMGVGR